MSKLYCIVLMLALVAVAGAQAPVPIRRIGPVLATSTENVGQGVVVRVTSDGHVIVGAGARQRVYAFDSTLKSFTLVVDSGSGTSSVAVRRIGLIPYLGDSTLFPDFGANALIVLDATGKQVRSMAPPRPRDLGDLAVPSTSGRPALDPAGRLVYRVNTPPRRPSQPTGERFEMNPMSGDSAAIVRGNFDTRIIDTLAWLKAPSPGRFGQEVTPNTGGPPTIIAHFLVNPFSRGDEWSQLSDGTIAIIRVQDYHIDWIDPDGAKRSSPKMPIDWRRYTDAEKQQIADSVKRGMEERTSRNIASRPPGASPMKLDVRVVPDSEFPTFWPPVEPGAVLADPDDHLWILPTTSTNAANGFTYDVVNRKGEIIERVQLPKGRALVGFGPHHAVYLTRAEGTSTYLERAQLTVPVR